MYALRFQWYFIWISVLDAIPVQLLVKIFGQIEKVPNICGGTMLKPSLAQGIRRNGKTRIFIKGVGKKAWARSA
jgi:hypothetical protein